jgi:hypothetical protein
MSRASYTALVAGLTALAVIAAAALLHYEVFQSSSGTGELRGSGIAATQIRALPGFDGVELSGSNNVVVRVGQRQTVVVHADDNLLDRVTTRVDGGTLVVGDRAGSFTTKSPMYVEITAPSLGGLALSGSGTVSVEGIRSPRLTVVLPGSGVIRAAGKAGRMDVALGGSGDAQLGQLVAGDVKVVVGGSGHAAVTATKSLDAAVTGVGAVDYGGHPGKVTKSVTGVGAISAR